MGMGLVVHLVWDGGVRVMRGNVVEETSVLVLCRMLSRSMLSSLAVRCRMFVHRVSGQFRLCAS